MKSTLETAAYFALIVLTVLQDQDEMNELEVKTTHNLVEQIKNTSLYEYEEDVDVAGLCFSILMDYIKEESA